MPTEFLSTPHELIHSSVSIYSAMFATITSDVLHWYSNFPSSFAEFSNKHLFPDDEIENEQIFIGKFSHVISPVTRFWYVIYNRNKEKQVNLVIVGRG